MGDGRWGDQTLEESRLNTQKRAERGHIGRKERGDGQDVCLEQGARMNLGGVKNEVTTSSSKGTHRNLTLRGAESRGYLNLCSGMELHHPTMSKIRDLGGQT